MSTCLKVVDTRRIASRLTLVEDSLKNTFVWQSLRENSLKQFSSVGIKPFAVVDVASQFVFGHGQFIRSLPPRLPASEEAESWDKQFWHRDAEVGAKLEEELAILGSEYVELRRTAWRAMTGNDVAAARVAMAGIRELCTDILHLLGSDEAIKKTDIWLERKDSSLARPTRRMRLEFIVGPAIAEFDALVQFDESLGHAHKFTHTFAEDPNVVRIALSQLENCLYLLLIMSRRNAS